MKHCLSLALAALAAVAVPFVSAEAQPPTQTKYSYYNVSGNSLKDIHRAIVSHGPMVNGTRGYGITMAAPGKQMTVAHCKANGGYRLSINVTIRLPRVAQTGNLSSSDIAQWNRFSQFVRKHEDRHRAIWQSCVADFQRKFLAGNTSDCGSAHSRAMKLWSETVSICKPKQVAFDAAQRSVLKAHPFMKYASR